MMEQVRSTGGTEIVGGTSASLADFPYIVSLTISGNLLCGGVLLNANTVLTAAHCSDIDPTTAKVRAGSTVSYNHNALTMLSWLPLPSPG